MYLDDILVSGPTVSEHLRNLEHVLSILNQSGLCLNKDKSLFLQDKVEYLGHIIDGEGLHPTQEKVRAIQEAPRPHNITELRSLGLTNYYAKFLPNLSARLSPLYRLLQKRQEWKWQDEQEDAFIAAKNALQEDSVLVHYDESKPLILTCDASPYGIGAVLSHTMSDGADRPVVYGLTKPEQGYAQIEREALAIVFEVQKFHYYLYGRQFTIQSDHKPLSFFLIRRREFQFSVPHVFRDGH